MKSRIKIDRKEGKSKGVYIEPIENALKGILTG